MNADEIATTFPCAGDTLVGIVHLPERPGPLGLLCIIAGGPQYRIGCCRQQVQLGRELASRGVAVMRFDFRGSGDASGTDPGLDRSEDINAAIDAFLQRAPQVERVVLYGGCDGASAIAIGGWRHPAVAAWVLNNPYTQVEEVRAKVMIKHYYRSRLFSKQLWRKILRLEFDFAKSLSGLTQNLRKARGAAGERNTGDADPFAPSRPFTQRMLEGWKRFDGRVLVLIGGRSLVAKEFDECVAASKEWQAVVRSDKVTRHVLPNADHTFSETQSRVELFKALADWFGQLGATRQ